MTVVVVVTVMVNNKQWEQPWWWGQYRSTEGERATHIYVLIMTWQPLRALLICQAVTTISWVATNIIPILQMKRSSKRSGNLSKE